jgi:hypothetical protein
MEQIYRAGEVFVQPVDQRENSPRLDLKNIPGPLQI